MLAELVDHVIGIDPDRDRVTAAIIASNTTAVITTEEFAANASGYRDLLVWADAHSDASNRVWSIEGTRSYGAGATLTLEEADEWVIEFDRPANAASKDRAKTDTLDAIRAAREALGRDKVATPRSSGKRSQLQALKVARDSAQRARVAAIKQLRALMVTSPVALRDELRGLTLGKLIDRASRLRHRGDNAGIKTALRTLARRVRNLDQEIKDLDVLIKGLIDEMAPQLLDEVGISYTTATQILLSWSHQGRCHSEAAFARLAGVAPIPASSGQTTRYRLSRGGDRQLNKALHLIVVTRCRVDPDTRAYMERRVAEGKTRREARRCLKRYVARHIFRILENPPTPLDNT